MRGVLAGIAIVVATAVGCGGRAPADGTLLVLGGAEFGGLTPDETKAAAKVIERRFAAADVAQVEVKVTGAATFEVFLPSREATQVGDWRLFLTTVGALTFRPLATAKVAGAASETDPPDGFEWLPQRGSSVRRLVKIPSGAAFPENAVTGGEVIRGTAGDRQVLLTFDPARQAEIERYTGTLVGGHLAIVMDGEILIAPKLREAFSESAIIATGSGFSREGAKRLAAVAASGPLPAPLKIDSSTDATR
jgi:preprotein translocase subunit SecD